MNLKSMIVKTEMSRVGGIVYEGGLVAPTEEVSSSVAPYRDYRETARIMSKMGMLFTVCSKIDPSEFNNPKHKDRNAFIRNEYWRAGAIFFNALPQNLLMQQLSRYDWGLLGHPESFPQWHTGIPNKLFDYISAGIPVIVLNADECARFVETHGIGVVIDRIEDIPKVYKDHKKYRKRVKQIQGKFTMEQQVPVIKAIYRKLMEDKNAEG